MVHVQFATKTRSACGGLEESLKEKEDDQILVDR